METEWNCDQDVYDTEVRRTDFWALDMLDKQSAKY